MTLLLVAAASGSCSGDGGSVFDGTPVGPGTSSPEVTTTGVPPTTVPDGTPALGRIELADTDPAAVVEVAGGLLQTDRIIVVLEPGSPPAVADQAAASLGGSVIGVLEYVDLYQISIPPAGEEGVRAAVEAARALPGVQLAYADELVTFSEEFVGVRTSPLVDPVYQGDSGGGYRAIGLERAWEYIRGSGIDPFGVRVGIVDTGLWRGGGEFDEAAVTSLNPAVDEVAQPEMAGLPRAAAGEPAWQTQSPDPGGGHGTEVTTIICGDGGDGGATGVATPVLGSRLECVHTNALDPNLPGWTPVAADPNDLTQITFSGATWSSRPLRGLLAQVQAGSKVINMSFGGHDQAPEISAAYRRFFEQMARDHPDVVFVASAGNDADSAPDGSRAYPGGFALPNVITVGNVNNDGTTAASSNQSSEGFEVTLAAPGDQAVRGVGPDGSIIDHNAVLGTASRTLNGQQQQVSLRAGGGTSMAAPQVTGAIALMKALDPTLTADEVKAILQATARTSLPAADPADADLPVSPGMGAGVLAIDEAVLAVINRVRTAQGMEEISGDQLVSLGVVDAVAHSGEPNEYLVRATVAGCRGDCTEVSISVSGDHGLGGSPTVSLGAPGEVEWDVTVTGEYPVTVFVQRLDNGAGSRILIQPTEIAGTWAGILTLTEILVPEGTTLPDGTPVEPGWHSFDEVVACSEEFGEQLEQGMAEAIEKMKEGVPITLTFTGTLAEPGTVVLSSQESSTPGTPIPWRMEGGSIVFEMTDEDSYGAFSLTPAGDTMTGAFGVVSFDPEGDTEMRGTLSLTRVDE